MIRRFDSKGVIAIIAAVALPVLLVLASGAIDLGRTYIVKQRLQTGVDAAALVAQVNAASATPETACQQATDAMNTALTANLTSNGFLGTLPPTLVSCSYDATAKRIVVTGNVSMNKTIGFAPSSVIATGYASLGDDQNTSPWMYQFKTQTANCQYNGYANTIILQSTGDQTLVMSGPVQNNCASTDWTNTESVVTGGNGSVQINNFKVIGTVIMNGTIGSNTANCTLSATQYLCVQNGMYLDGDITDNIPITVSNNLTLVSGTTLKSTLSPPETLYIISGSITGSSTDPVTLSNININTKSSPFTIGSQYTLNISDSSTFLGPIITKTGSTVNITNKSNFVINNSGSSINGGTININDSSWTNDDTCTWCTINNVTLNLNNSTMISGSQSYVTANLTEGSKLTFLSGTQILGGTYTLKSASSINISKISQSIPNTTIVLYDTSTIIANGTTYAGPGTSDQSYYTFLCTGPTTCTRK